MSAETKDIASKIKEAKGANKFPAMLEVWKGEIARALPKHVNADRMARIVLTSFRNNAKLQQCEPLSIFAAVLQASQLGLEPDMLGRSYLVPYYDNKSKQLECQFIPGWKGLVDLANNTNQCSVWTGAVFEGDEFSFQLGDSPYIRHIPRGEDDPEKLTHVYAVGRTKSSDYPVIEVWPMAKIWKHRDRYNKVGNSHYSFKNKEMYARKIPLLQVLKYMPSSPEVAQAIALSNAAEIGAQGLTIDSVIDGSWTAPDLEPETSPEGDQANAAATKEKITSKKPKAPTYAEIADAIKNAKDADALDVAGSLIGEIADEAQRKELMELYETKLEIGQD